MKIFIEDLFLMCHSEQRMRRNLILFFLSFFLINTITSQQNNLQNFSITDGLPSLSINDILQDEIGYLWLATDKGLVKFDGNEFKKFNLQSSSKINSLFYKNDTLFIGSEKGFFIKTSTKTTYLGKEKVLKIIAINDKIILGTTEGIYELREDYLQPLQINTQLDYSIINDILFDGKSIYVASNKGLWKLSSLKKVTKNKKIIDNNVTSLLLNNKKIIAGTYRNGIKVIENDTISSTIRTERNSVKNAIIDNEIWVATLGNGIEIFNADNFTFQRKINKYNTLITNNINTVFEDKQHNVWIGTSDKGIYKLKTGAINPDKTKPIVYLESIAVNYQNLDSIDINNYNKTLKLNPSQNNLSISFKTVDLNHPKNIQYRYKIANKFSPWNTNNSVDFGSLNAGNYTFSVQSRNNHLLESNLKKFTFFIEIPIYKEGWFLISLYTLILFILSVIVEFYIRKNRKKNQQKINQLKLDKHLLTLEQKALQLQMNPHFIFNVLNGIKALGNNGKTKELNETISQFSVLLRSVLSNSRLEEINLQDEIKTLKNYLDLEKKMNSKRFEYVIKTDLNNIDAEEILIPPMLLQPFIENAIKHGIQPKATNGEITVDFKINRRFLECSIIDNGIGFYQSKQQDTNHKSLALTVTKERIENLSNKNSFSINEVKNENTVLGTKVWFRIPFKTDY